MKSYTAKRQIRDGRTLIEPGGKIDLEDRAAAPMLRIGAIAEDAPAGESRTDAPVKVPAADDLIGAAIRDLKPEAYGSSGKPGVDAIRAALPAGIEFSAADRDRVWDAMVKDGLTAPQQEQSS